MEQLPINQDQIDRVKGLAKDIAGQVQSSISKLSSLSVERTVLRLYGVDGVDSHGVPLPNLLADMLQKKGAIQNGVSRSFAQAMVETGKDAQTTAELIADGHIPFDGSIRLSPDLVVEKEGYLAGNAVAELISSRERKIKKERLYGVPVQPWRYVIVATGNVYEDKTQALAAAITGADIIAQIRSTAQSLLDYIPYGHTTEGVGGTYATQANFKIMRQALDEASKKEGRLIRLVNYSSGLCMAEIAACAVFEDLDMLLNDSMYGILFRDINMTRTFIDQYFSRLICAKAGIIINTGEDNYLTTSDAIESAYTVTASQLINEAMGKIALLEDKQLGLGHAFEIDPKTEDGFLYEIAHAQLARQLFPNSPIKYMPPTKHKSRDIFYSNTLDTLFNVSSIITGQGIHLAGMMTEAIHTPLMHDRFHALNNINTVFNFLRHFKDEIQFRPNGIIARRAQQVLDDTESFLNKIKKTGLRDAISKGEFANISRPYDGGKGLDGVFKKGEDYSNPIMDRLEGAKT